MLAATAPGGPDTAADARLRRQRPGLSKRFGETGYLVTTMRPAGL